MGHLGVGMAAVTAIMGIKSLSLRRSLLSTKGTKPRVSELRLAGWPLISNIAVTCGYDTYMFQMCNVPRQMILGLHLVRTFLTRTYNETLKIKF